MTATDILIAIAEQIEAHKCSSCAAHDEHEVCELPDLARILREVARKAEKGFVMPARGEP